LQSESNKPHKMTLRLRFSILFWLFASCALLMLMSCQSDSDDVSAPEGQCTISFTVSNYRQISFDDLSAGTRADVPTDHPTTLAHLLIAVYNAETGQQACEPIRHDQNDYVREDQWDDYPKFSVTLPYGRYRVLVLGYNGNSNCNITSVNHITWENNYVPNTFFYCEELTFDKNTSLDQKITLKRAVSAFRIETEDAIPAEVKKMRFMSTAGGMVLDATTGFTPQSTGRTSDVTVLEQYVGKASSFTAYLFLPSGEQTTSTYTVQALGQNDNVLYEKHFNNVPLRINVLTVWQGKFFEASSVDVEEHNAGISLYWDTKWEDTIILNP